MLACLTCAFLCHIMSLQYLSRLSPHRLAGLPCCLFLSYIWPPSGDMGRRTFTHRTFTHRTVAHRTFTHRTVAHQTVAHRIFHAYLILKRVLLANSTFIWYFNENRTHGCVERIVSVTGSACLPVCDAVLPKRAAVNQPILLDFLFLYGSDSDPIIVYMDPNIAYICYFGKRYCSLTQQHPGLESGSRSHPGQVYAQSIPFRYMCYELASN